jgi:thiol-disulfide isomerase/thioredoxin
MRINFLRFVLLGVLAVGLGACGAPANNEVNTAAIGNSANTDEVKVYPLIPASFASTEFEILDGTKFKIADKKGKVLLLNIWGIWCGPCIAEMPHLVEIYEKHKDNGLEVIGLNMGDENGNPENVDKIKAFVTKFEPKLTYPIAISNRAATAQFQGMTGKNVVPQTMLIDRENKLRGIFIGGGRGVLNTMKQTVDKTMAE